MRTLKLALAGMLATVLLTAADARAAIITFENIGGETGDPFIAPYSEAGFQVAPITGRWLKGTVGGKVAGNPQPVIYGDTFTASLEVTELTGRPFFFSSIDIGNTFFDGLAGEPVSYTLEGFLGSRSVFTTSGEAAGFETVASPSRRPIDRLLLSMVREQADGYAIDNINVRPVPEPASIAIWLGIAAACFAARRRKRA